MAQVFKTTDYTIGKLVDDIEIGDIALPDIQRPFVWYRKISKVRDLFDSIYRGYPIGYLLFWENANRSDYKNIGFDEKKRKIPRFLIIDGQQRLTALFAVIKKQEVLTPDYEKKKIKIPGGSLHGQKIRLKGDGLVRPGSYEKGDLYIILNIQMPSKLSKEEFKTYEKLAKDKGLKIDPQIKTGWL